MNPAGRLRDTIRVTYDRCRAQLQVTCGWGKLEQFSRQRIDCVRGALPGHPPHGRTCGSPGLPTLGAGAFCLAIGSQTDGLVARMGFHRGPWILVTALVLVWHRLSSCNRRLRVGRRGDAHHHAGLSYGRDGKVKPRGYSAASQFEGGGASATKGTSISHTTPEGSNDRRTAPLSWLTKLC